MIEYINLGTIVDIDMEFFTPDDVQGHHITIDFLTNESVIFDRLQNGISKLLTHPNNYLLCDIEDVIQARKEFEGLKKRVEELEDQLANAKKESDKKLCEVYRDSAEIFYKSADKLISIDKMIAELKKENQDLKERNEEGNKHLGFVENNAKFWHGRAKEFEKDRDYWKNRFNSAVTDFSKTLAANGVEFTVKAIDGNKWNVIIDIPELNEAKQKISELEAKCNAKWSAMLQALKEKGVEVLYMGEEDGKPNIDVKIPEIDIIKKELEDLKSKTVAEARFEWKPNCFTLICTMCDGSKQTTGIDLSESIDATSISCGTVPKCKSCKNHRYYGKIGGHVCHLPDLKRIIPNTFDIFPLTDEEAEGPACNKFEAKKEADYKDCKHYKKALWKVSIDGEGVGVCVSPKTRYGFCKNNCNGEKACSEFERKEE